MTLTASIAATTKSLTLQVRINGVLLVPSAPTSATGIPAVSAIRIANRIGQAPVCAISTNRTPTWVLRGMTVTVDVGYDGFTRRRFTGTVQDRSKGIGKGTINCVGASSPLYSTSIIPDRDLSGQTTAAGLGGILDYVGVTNRTISTTRADVAEFTMGTVTPTLLQNMTASQMVNYVMELQGCKIFETGAGVTVISVIDEIPAVTPLKTYTTNNNATARILTSDLREDPTYVRTRTKVNGATPVGGTTLTATEQVVGISPLVKPPLPSGSYIDSGVFNSLADTQAKVNAMAVFYLTQWHRVPKYLDIDLPGDPEIECGATLGLVIPEQDINGNFFVSGWEDSITVPQSDADEGGGYRTTLSGLRGGDELGGTISAVPIAIFTYTIDQEVIGNKVVQVVTLDFSGSYDPDGTLASITVSDNQTPDIFTGSVSVTTKLITASFDPTVIVGDFIVTAVVTDNSGLTATVSQTIPIDSNTSSAVTLPAIFVAMNNNASATPDGGQTWHDASGSTCVSVGARPSDGVNSGHACFGFNNGVIKRTTDFCNTALTTVYTFPSATAVNCIAWDWRNTQVVWALSANFELAVSLDAGVTWGLYGGVALRTTLGIAGAIAGRRAIGLPAAGGIYLGGGTGTGLPLIVFDPNLTGTWTRVTFTGDLATDTATPADATMRIIDYTAPGNTFESMILEWASGGGANLKAIYTTPSPAGPTRAYTRATGLTAGLKTGRCIVGDAVTPAITFHAMFADRDVWDSSDGIAWTQRTNVLPAGVTPNDALFLSDVLTGLPGFQGVYAIAAENAGSTLGIYKSVDGLLTVAALRPATGFPAWPSSAKAKMLSVGAPGQTVALSNNLAFIDDASSPQLWLFNASSTWTKRWTAPASAFFPERLAQLSGGYWLYLLRSSNLTGSQLWYSGNNGTSFSIVIPVTVGSVSYGPVDFDIAPDGTVWAVQGTRNQITNGQNTQPLAILKSTDHGATWSTVHTNAGFTGGGLTNANNNPIAIAVDPSTGRISVACFGSRTNEARWIESTDGGGSWTTRTTGNAVSYSSTDGDSMFYCNSGRLLYRRGGSSGVLQYSDDFGVTWTSCSFSPAIPSSNNQTRDVGWWKPTWFNRNVFVADDTAGNNNRPLVYVTTNNGANWTLIQTLAWVRPAGSIEYDAANDIIYVASRSGGVVAAKIASAFGTSAATDITFNLTDVGGIHSMALPR